MTYPHMLAFGLHMAIMTDPAFPAPAIGTVHLENSITSHRPIGIGERLAVAARVGQPGRTPRAPSVDFVTEVRDGRRGRGLGERPRPTCVAARVSDGATAAGSDLATVPVPDCPGGCPATWAVATPRSRATTTRSTCTRSPRRPWASPARSPTACGPWRAASRRWRTGCPTPSGRRGLQEADPAARARSRSGHHGRVDDGYAFSLTDPRKRRPAPGRPHRPRPDPRHRLGLGPRLSAGCRTGLSSDPSARRGGSPAASAAARRSPGRLPHAEVGDAVAVPVAGHRQVAGRAEGDLTPSTRALVVDADAA